MLKRWFNTFIVLIMCIVPLIIVPTNADYYYLPKITVIYILCLFAFPFLIYTAKKEDFHLDTRIYLSMLCIFLLILSTIFSVDIKQSLFGRPFRYEGMFAILCYFIIFFISSYNYKFSKIHIFMLIISALLISTYGIFQYFGYDFIPKDSIRTSWIKEYAYSTLGNPNFFASYLVLILPISIFYYSFSKNIFYLFSSSVLYLAILCSRTRGCWLGFFFSFLLLLFFSYKNKNSLKPFITIGIFFIIITLAFNYYKNNAVVNRFSTIISDAKAVTESTTNNNKAGTSRILIWKSTLKILWDNPILGSGPDTFDIVFMKKFSKDWVGTILDKAHNEYLQMAVTLGFPFLISYLAMVFSILKDSVKSYKKNILIIPLFCSITGYLIQAFFNISVVSVAPIYWCMLGILSKSLKGVFDYSTTNNSISAIEHH